MAWDELYYDNTDLGASTSYSSNEEYQKAVEWFELIKRKAHRTVHYKKPIGKITDAWFVKKGDVWIGSF